MTWLQYAVGAKYHNICFVMLDNSVRAVQKFDKQCKSTADVISAVVLAELVTYMCIQDSEGRGHCTCFQVGRSQQTLRNQIGTAWIYMLDCCDYRELQVLGDHRKRLLS